MKEPYVIASELALEQFTVKNIDKIKEFVIYVLVMPYWARILFQKVCKCSLEPLCVILAHNYNNTF